MIMKIGRYVPHALLMCVIAGLVSGCAEPITYDIGRTEIVAVYYHEENVYSVAEKTADGVKIKRLPFRHGVIPKRIITDVPPGQPMWYSCSGGGRDVDEHVHRSGV
jgi:hypothetical protein